MKRATSAMLLLFFLAVSLVNAADAEVLEFAGSTMGTTYAVKIFEPGELNADIQLDVDAELRRVNDQMSTYLESSEISRFNSSTSTDWFDVSLATAQVVEYAQTVSKATDGAFDVTVAPLVNAWSFGPASETRVIPSADILQQLSQSVGYQKLHVRLDPPSLRKDVAGLSVDLSAIAKGHGVDRVVEMLNDRGAANVFVEIGGEVRVSGNKAGQWWKVGIEVPESDRTEIMIAHSLGTGGGGDEAMATSGDYRNFFEVDGRRYSHTIDPRTGRPVEHQLASVSVVSDSCMKADAWATAINVLGPEAGLALARKRELDVLLVSRDGEELRRAGNGSLAKYETGRPAHIKPAAPAANNTLATLLITFVAFALLLFLMAVGVVFGRHSISGSCGGLANSRNEDGSISCALCSNPDEACRELRRRMQNSAAT